MGTADERDDRVLAYTRGLSLFIVPFLLVAFVILYVFPDHTGRLWAWTIPVTMTSMVLASAYLGGAYFFLHVARTRHWHEVGSASSRQSSERSWRADWRVFSPASTASRTCPRWTSKSGTSAASLSTTS